MRTMYTTCRSADDIGSDRYENTEFPLQKYLCNINAKLFEIGYRFNNMAKHLENNMDVKRIAEKQSVRRIRDMLIHA